jgi:hypothetical protein
MNALKPYLPSLGMILAAVLQALYAALDDGKVSSQELLTLFIALLGAVTLYIVPKVQGATWLKPLVAGLTAAGVAGQTAYADGHLSAQDYVTVLIQLLVGFGIVLGTNRHVPETPGAPVYVGEHREAGQTNIISVVLGVLLVVILVLLILRLL